MIYKFVVVVVLGGLVASAAYLATQRVSTQPAGARFLRQVAWSGRGVWLKADTHTHTQFTDGQSTVSELVSKAIQYGCDAVAVTDHLDSNLKGATPEYFAAVQDARTANPKTVILAGGEWNIPPFGGDEHGVVLVAPAVERSLAEFKRQFDDLRRPTHEASLARDGLRWLAANASVEGTPPVVVYEHPSRADEKSMANADDMRGWRAVNDLVIGFAGAPGHQAMRPYGGYQKEQTIDRWDPVAARLGDAWDVLLGEGLEVWAALAPSDFHTDVGTRFNDYWPCQFGGTWLYAPQRDELGVLQALRAGAFFAEHGNIAREVQMRVSAAGLPRPAGAGEAIAVAPGTSVTVEVHFQMPTEPSRSGGRVDRVEIIAVDSSGSKVVFGGAPDARQTVSHVMRMAKGDVVFRARGFSGPPEGERLAFYTNPVRVSARP
jgi:hypothetical protein